MLPKMPVLDFHTIGSLVCFGLVPMVGALRSS